MAGGGQGRQCFGVARITGHGAPDVVITPESTTKRNMSYNLGGGDKARHGFGESRITCQGVHYVFFPPKRLRHRNNAGER